MNDLFFLVNGNSHLCQWNFLLISTYHCLFEVWTVVFIDEAALNDQIALKTGLQKRIRESVWFLIAGLRYLMSTRRVKLLQSWLPTPGDELPGNFVELHIFCQPRKGFLRRRHHRVHHTGPRLHSPSDNWRRTWGFFSALRKLYRIEPVVRDAKYTIFSHWSRPRAFYILCPLFAVFLLHCKCSCSYQMFVRIEFQGRRVHVFNLIRSKLFELVRCTS